jgi:hypothetical protein
VHRTFCLRYGTGMHTGVGQIALLPVWFELFCCVESTLLLDGQLLRVASHWFCALWRSKHC